MFQYSPFLRNLTSMNNSFCPLIASLKSPSTPLSLEVTEDERDMVDRLSIITWWETLEEA